MDIRLPDAAPTVEERSAVDAAIGGPTSAWDGGARGSARDAHTAAGGASVRGRRHELVPALQALQARVGWISEGGLGYVCERLNVPPADAWGVATFYALLATSPRPRRVLHLCSDIACAARGAHDIEHALGQSVGPAISGAPDGDAIVVRDADCAWMHSPCLGMCDMAPAAFLAVAGESPKEMLFGRLTPEEATIICRPERSEGPALSATDKQVLCRPCISQKCSIGVGGSSIVLWSLRPLLSWSAIHSVDRQSPNS